MINAITLWQPYASLVAHGLKLWETRGWRSNYTGLIAIHAAARKMSREDRRYLEQLRRHFPAIAQAMPDDKLPLKAVLCVCHLDEYCQTHAIAAGLSEMELALGNYRPARWAWHIPVQHVFEDPITVSGSHLIWKWAMPESVMLERMS